MQRILIQYLLNPLCRRMEPVSGRVKNILFLLGGTGILTTMFLQNAEALEIRYIFWFAANCFFLGLLLLGTLPEEISPVRWNKPLFFFWMAAASLRCLSGVTQNSNYFAEGLMLIAAWPMVFLIFANADTSRLIHLMMILIRFAVVAFTALSFLFSPISPGEYTGFFENANSTGHFLAAASTVLTLAVLCDRGKKWIPDCILLGLAWTLNLYTNSRTSLLAAVVALAGGLAMFLIKGQWKRLLRLGAALAAGVVFLLTLVYVFQLRGFLNIPYFDPESRSFYTATRQELWARESEAFAEHMEKEVFFDASMFTNRSEERFESGEQTLDRYSTGRLSLWHSCIIKLNLTGHPTAKDQFYTSTRNKLFSSAHMVVLQYAFESGIPMGLSYLIMNILSGLYAIGFAWRNRSRDWTLLPLMAALCFGVLSVLESCCGSLHFLGTTLYYFSLVPIITRQEAAQKP